VEPFEYLRLFRRRWMLLVACVLIAAAAAWVTAPTGADDTPVQYEADATIVRDSQAATPQALATVDLFMRTGEVPRRVADRIGFEGNPIVLGRGLETEFDEVVGTLTVTAIGNSPEEAADLANAAAEETLAFLGEQAQATQQAATEQINAEVTQLQTEIDALQNDIRAAEDAEESTDLLEAQRDAKLGQYGAALVEQQQLADLPPPTAGYLVLEPSTAELASPVDEGFSAPRSRPVRASVGALLGLLLGGAAILIVERVDPRLNTREQVEEAFGLPVVAEIPDVPKRDHAIVSATDPSSAAAEAYRSLRASLLLMPTLELGPTGPRVRDGDVVGGGEPRVVLITSPEPGDGKTTTVANLAAGFAETGRSVLVMGCDFRRPQVHKYLGAAERPGLADLFTDSGSLDLIDILQPTKIEGVRIAANGSELASLGDVAAAGRQMLTRARSHADVVLVDTAPMLATNDATELIPAVDSVVVLCRAGKTTREAARRTCELLARLRAPIVGVALVGGRSTEAAYSRYYTSDRTPSRPAHARRLRRRRAPAA
jgi:capsular exopolysaccharide synthesis family protein